MELLGFSASAEVSPSFHTSSVHRNPNFFFKVMPCNSLLVSSVETRLWNSLSCVRINANDKRNRFFLQSIRKRSNIHSAQLDFFFIRNEGYLPKLRRFTVKLKKVVKCSVNFKDSFPVIFFRLVVGVMLFMAVTVPVAKSPSWALTEENILFLEAWRTIDRAYVDKTFNGQSWFRYRENALRNEPMNTREETYVAIRKMLATLDDPFTRFLEPEKFKSLRAVWNTRCSYRSRDFNWLSNRK